MRVRLKQNKIGIPGWVITLQYLTFVYAYECLQLVGVVFC